MQVFSQTCNGLALRLVQKAGDGEGFEAWRQLLNRFDPINKQSVVGSLIRALRWELGSKDPLDGLEVFEKWVADYEVERERLVGEETRVPDDIKIGIVIAGLPKGVMRDHLMLRSESMASYVSFRKEYETIARAKLVRPSPWRSPT